MTTSSKYLWSLQFALDSSQLQFFVLYFAGDMLVQYATDRQVPLAINTLRTHYFSILCRFALFNVSNVFLTWKLQLLWRKGVQWLWNPLCKTFLSKQPTRFRWRKHRDDILAAKAIVEKSTCCISQ